MDYATIFDDLGQVDWFTKKLEGQIDEFYGDTKAFLAVSEDLIEQRFEISHTFGRLKKSYMSIIDDLLSRMEDHNSNFQREKFKFDEKIAKLQKKIRELEEERKNGFESNGNGDVKLGTVGCEDGDLKHKVE